MLFARPCEHSDKVKIMLFRSFPPGLWSTKAWAPTLLMQSGKQNKFVKSRGILQTGGTKERGAWQTHKRLLYCVNVNRTSLDHLLLGGNADVNKYVE